MLLDLLLPPRPAAPDEDPGRIRDEMSGTRQRMREQLRAGKLDDRLVEIDVQEKSFPSIELITGSSMEEVGVNLRDMMPGLFQGRSKRRRVTVAEARERLAQEDHGRQPEAWPQAREEREQRHTEERAGDDDEDRARPGEGVGDRAAGDDRGGDDVGAGEDEHDVEHRGGAPVRGNRYEIEPAVHRGKATASGALPCRVRISVHLV